MVFVLLVVRVVAVQSIKDNARVSVVLNVNIAVLSGIVLFFTFSHYHLLHSFLVHT